MQRVEKYFSMKATPVPPSCMSSSQSESSLAPENRFMDTDRAACLLRGLADLYQNKQFMDVTLVVGEREYQCHKMVLAISSPYFMAMFSSNMLEKQENRVHIQEMSGSTVELVLDYIYTGEVDFTEDTIQSLLSAANLFQLLALRNGCADYMIKHVCLSNCIGVFFFAKAHQCDTLASKAKELINLQFDTLWRETEFVSLPIDKVVELLRDDGLIVSQEEQVYEACLAWLHYSLDERRAHLLALLQCVRFPNISSYYFCDNIDTLPLFQNCSDLKEILDTVKYFHMLKNRQAEIDLNYVPRKGLSYERGILIMANPYSEDNGRKFNTMDLLLPKTGEVRHLCKLPQSLYMPSACTSGDNQIFLAGGAIRKINYRGPYMSEGVSSNLFLFDKMFGSWQVKSKMHYGRSQFCLQMLDGWLYAVGGQNEVEVLDVVERYDQQTNLWKVVTPLPKKLRCIATTAYKGKLFVFGGETETEIVKTAYRYDPTAEAWLELPSMHTPRALAGCVVYQQKIYVIGGNSAVSSKWRKEFLPEHCVSTVEVYDPVDGVWSFGPELPNALCGAGVVKYGDTIMAVGGEDDKSWMAGLFTLRQDRDQQYWVEGQELPTVLSTFACVVANIPKELFRERDEL